MENYLREALIACGKSPDQVLFSTGEVASICGVSIDTVRSWIHDSVLKASQFGHNYCHRVRRDHLVALLEDNYESI
ncbi:MAG: helix-turn-helix domain-containing protein [Magnetococcales bacterium]|nr:helix-turn-helix domain-containing protein [Magnetococcales bacterium]